MGPEMAAQSSGEWPGSRRTFRDGFWGLDVMVGGGVRPEEEVVGGPRAGAGPRARWMEFAAGNWLREGIRPAGGLLDVDNDGLGGGGLEKDGGGMYNESFAALLEIDVPSSRENVGTEGDGFDGRAFGVVSSLGSIKVGVSLSVGGGGGGMSAASLTLASLTLASDFARPLRPSGDVAFPFWLLLPPIDVSPRLPLCDDEEDSDAAVRFARLGSIWRQARNHDGIHGGGRIRM